MAAPQPPGKTRLLDPWIIKRQNRQLWTEAGVNDLDTATRSALSAASIGELAWVDADGCPHVEGAIPMLLDGAPAIAFTYAEHDLAVDVAAADRLVVAVTEPRSTGSTFRPLVCAGRPRLVPDPTGDLFVDDLLTQELRRYPPSRLLVDSPMLRREHWWYLPRMIVVIEVDDVRDIPARGPLDDDGTGDHVLAVANPGGVEVGVVAVGGLSPASDRLDVALVDDRIPPSGPAALFAQDASFPDLERWSEWTIPGAWDADGARFTAAAIPSSTGLEPVPSLLRRWRRQRDLERRCRKGLANYA